MRDERILADLLAQLRPEFGESARVLAVEGGCLSLGIGPQEEAVIGIRVDDPARPSFHVSYPASTLRRGRTRVVCRVTRDGVTCEGVAWIARRLVRHGVGESGLCELAAPAGRSPRWPSSGRPAPASYS